MRLEPPSVHVRAVVALGGSMERHGGSVVSITTKKELPLKGDSVV